MSNFIPITRTRKINYNPKKYIRAYFAAKREDAKNKWFGTFYVFREYNNIMFTFLFIMPL